MRKVPAKAFYFLILSLFMSGFTLFALDTQEAGKKYAPLVGDYEFDVQGQIMIISFWVEEGKLWGAPEGESAAQLEPVEGVAMKLEVNAPNGRFYELEFVEDESGEVTRCIVATMGMGMEGVKVE